MNSRRNFLKSTAALTLAAGAGRLTAAPDAPSATSAKAGMTGIGEREYWVTMATRLADPILNALAAGKLKAVMPVEARHPADRAPYTHLEAVGRLLAGLAPWIEGRGAEVGDATTGGTESGTLTEERRRQALAERARLGIAAITDPASPDFIDFARPGQTLVDAAFLAQALLRAPTGLWGRLPATVKSNVLAALVRTRSTKPGENNWVLFASMVEAALLQFGGTMDAARLNHGLAQHEKWYVGDGMYGDGPEFHWDYYNAFVIQPMLLEVLEVVVPRDDRWRTFHDKVRTRLTRYAAIQERLVAPDGTYPVIGRSSAYRCGAFQALALAAWRHLLPEPVAPAQARVALGAVIRRTLEAPGTFDAEGWLRIGVCGHQPSLGETYISTGSLYLCSVALLPLGLAPSDPFWADADRPTTAQQIWSGRDVPADHALGRH